MQYESFRASAYKNKYEIAIETDSLRVSYGELIKTTGGFYNSLCQMSLYGKTVAVFTGGCVQTVSAVFAALKADCKCVVISPAGNLERINKSLSVYRPDIAVVYGKHLERLAPSLIAFGTSTAVVVGDDIPEQQYLPSVYSFDELVDINDYSVQTPSGKDGSIVFDAPSAEFLYTDAIENLGKRDGVLFDLPLYTEAAYRALCNTLEGGKKCVFLKSPDKKTAKKKKIKLAVVANEKDYDCQMAFATSDEFYSIGGQILDIKQTEQYISEQCGYPAKIAYDGHKLKLFVELGRDADIAAVKSSPLAAALSGICAEAFFAINCTKSIVFKKEFDYNNTL